MEPKPYLREIELKRDDIPSFEEYPFSLPVVRELDVLGFHPDVTFFVGENGTGKSTLVEAIATAMGLNPEGGNKNTTFATEETHASLSKYIKTVKSYKKPRDYYFLRAESFYNVATYMDSLIPPPLQGYGGKSLHRQSHGEAFMAVLAHKLKGNGLYIMDEPEAALSPTRQMAALVEIHRLVAQGSQFIVATHSPILLSYPRAKIYQIDDCGVSEVAYTDTDHYEVTRGFLNRHETVLKELLDGEA
jgi:predicted ATPase